MKDIKIGQKVYYLDASRKRIIIRSGKVTRIYEEWVLLRRKFSIKVDFEDLPYDYIFLSKQEAIDYLKSEIARLKAMND